MPYESMPQCLRCFRAMNGPERVAYQIKLVYLTPKEFAAPCFLCKGPRNDALGIYNKLWVDPELPPDPPLKQCESCKGWGAHLDGCIHQPPPPVRAPEGG